MGSSIDDTVETAFPELRHAALRLSEKNGWWLGSIILGVRHMNYGAQFPDRKAAAADAAQLLESYSQNLFLEEAVKGATSCLDIAGSLHFPRIFLSGQGKPLACMLRGVEVERSGNVPLYAAVLAVYELRPAAH